MSPMTRSKTQVLRGYLPEQSFQHENETIAKVARLTASPAPVNEDILLETLAERLRYWQQANVRGSLKNRAPGFVDPLRHRRQYVALEPDGEVMYYLWPLVLRCRDVSCAKVAVLHGRDAWRRASNPELCDRCKTRREQMPYLMVHNCGRDAELSVTSCDTHGMQYVFLEDTGSFETSLWRCGAPGCDRRPLGGMRYRACSCGEPGPYVSVTIRQNTRYIPQTFSFVSFDTGPVSRLREESGADKVAVGCYLGLFGDFERALEDARRHRGGDPATWERIERALRNDPDVTEEIIDEARANHFGQSGEAFVRLSELVPDDVVSRVGRTQGAVERTLIFGGAGALRTWTLPAFREAALETNRPGAAARIDSAALNLTECGFSDLMVVENFPVALVAYGFTRVGRTPEKALLTPFPAPRQAQYRDKTPLYVSKSNTEAIFFELDAERVLLWLARNSLLSMPDLPEGDGRAVAAKAAAITVMDGDPALADIVLLLQHTLAHALIRNLGERSGFGEETMAEYLIPGLLTIGLYADVHQEFTLGALVSLAEHRLSEWLDATRDGARSCPWDPQCAHEEGACASCLYLAFGCGAFNHQLDRAVLFGSPAGHELRLLEGYWT